MLEGKRKRKKVDENKAPLGFLLKNLQLVFETQRLNKKNLFASADAKLTTNRGLFLLEEFKRKHMCLN